MMKRVIVSIFLCLLFMVVSGPSIKGAAIQPYVTPLDVATFAQFQSALSSGDSEINVNITDEFSLSDTIAINPTTKNITITSNDNVTLTKTSETDYIFMIRSEVKITFDHKITFDNNLKKGMFRIYGTLSGSEVELNNLILKNGATMTTIYHDNPNLGLSVNNSVFTNNKSNGSGGTINFNGPQLNVNDTTFTEGYAKFGGGISIEPASQLTFKNSIITDCEAQINGGAINAKVNTQVNIISGNISNNKAINGGAIHGYAGVSGGVITLGSSDTKPVLNNNVADEGAKLNGLYNGFGGAIFAKELIVNNAQISSNKATRNGGGIYANIIKLNDGEITYNEAEKGGGIFAGAIDANSKVDVVINGGNIDYNKATSTATGQLGGGGLTIGDPTDSGLINFQVNGGSISHNTAYANGGGISITYHTNTIIKDANINDNKVIGSVSGLKDVAVGGGIYVRTDSRSQSVTIAGDTIISNNSANGNGGGVFFQSGDLTIKDNATLSKNTSVLKNGGGIFTSKILFENGNILENKAELDGGAVYVDDLNYTSEFNRGLIQKNMAVNGGAVFSKSPLKIDGDITFLENESSEYGGAIYSTDTFTVANKASFKENFAGNNGGALYLRFEGGKSANIIGASFDANKSLKDGGAIYATSIETSDPLLGLKSLFVQEDSTFSDNKAQKSYNWFVDESATDPNSVSKIYMSNIFTSASTHPFANIYNNYDTGFGLTPLLVTFDFNSPADPMDNVHVHVYPNERVNPLSVENLLKYHFLDWREDEHPYLVHDANVSEVVFFDFTTPIVEDKTLYGQWIELKKENGGNGEDNNEDGDDNDKDKNGKDGNKDKNNKMHKKNGSSSDKIDLSDGELPTTGFDGLAAISVILVLSLSLVTYMVMRRER